MSSVRLAELFAGRSTVNWFPGHMAKATRQLKESLKGSDIVLEVRDARIPFSSANSHLDNITKDKCRVILFHKSDLSDPTLNEPITKYFKEKGHLVFFTSTKHAKKQLLQIIPAALEHLRIKRGLTKPKEMSQMIVVGYPNVGKSTLINTLREAHGTGRKVARTGARPGVTRAISGFKVSDNPISYMLDSPGVMAPGVADLVIGLKLALTSAVRDALIDQQLLAEFLRSSIGEKANVKRIESAMGVSFDLRESASDFLERIARRNSFRLSPKTSSSPNTKKLSSEPSKVDWDLEAAAQLLIRKFRDGSLGRYTLDEFPPPLSTAPTASSSTTESKRRVPSKKKKKLA